MMQHHHQGMMGAMMTGNWFWTITLAVIILGIAIGALILLLKITNDNRKIADERHHALDLLSERYAKGEISEEEYIQKRKTIEEYDSLK